MRNRFGQLALFALVGAASAGAAGNITTIGTRADGSAIHAWLDPQHAVPASRPHVLVVGKSDFADAGWVVTRVEAPTPGLKFPPKGDAYQGPDREAHFLWRWVQTVGPDTVLGDDAFSRALVETGMVRRWLSGATSPSPLSTEVSRRFARSPHEVARKLAANYGHRFDQVQYIPALALIGRMRIAERSGDQARIDSIRHLALAAPEPKSLTGPVLAGHLIFAELARHDPEARARLLRAAGVAFDAAGRPLPFVPLHEEMSDSVFMICPLLAAAGELTGEARYYAACLNHLRFMRQRCVRPDGLYRHSPLHDAAWGRGNGFPALGLALTLARWPESIPGREEVLGYFREHLAALVRHQEADGMWHQVIDHPESYREFSATGMIAHAMAVGVREGWLDATAYGPRISRAWDALKVRIDLRGEGFVDVCTGTGKQRTLDDYLRRTAILGRDDRGGAFALLLAAELDR